MTNPRPLRESRWLAGIDLPTCGILLLGLAALYLPTYLDLARQVWTTEQQSYGPIILALSLWLIYDGRRDFVHAGPPAPAAGAVLVGFGLLLHALGRSQDILMFQAGSQIPVFAGLLVLFHGWRGLRRIWFPLFFLLFMVPLPELLVAAVTSPLKQAVSAVATELLYRIGYPVAREGVTISIGPYKLLVADACAGLNSMFSLEALGMFYMNLMRYTSKARNVSLAALLIPISFCANVVRVCILALITFYFGDEAGQGFVHQFAGMLLFLVGLMIMLAVDKLFNVLFHQDREKLA